MADRQRTLRTYRRALRDRRESERRARVEALVAAEREVAAMIAPGGWVSQPEVEHLLREMAARPDLDWPGWDTGHVIPEPRFVDLCSRSWCHGRVSHSAVNHWIGWWRR